MTEQEWLACTDPGPILASLRGRASDRKLRLFACGVCRQLASLLRSEDYVRAIEAGESYADGGRMRAAMRRGRRALDGRMVRSVDTSGKGQTAEWHALFLGHLAICERDFRAFPTCLSQLTLVRVENEDAMRRLIQTARRIAMDILGNPFRPVALDPAWQTPNAITLAQAMYDTRDFAAMPLLADLLEEAGCPHEVSEHCRGPGPHVRGCWVVDLVLGKG
jgi:hypothetical protein